ncbi:hypothetical protein HYS94_04825 [Candidatus Daviesbacteria bacterium]|nr:hypothetical protein [Candidatus Daviesbacteria bacterium]
MKIKGLILVTFFAIVAALSLSQTNIVSAQSGLATSPVTSPVTYYTYHLTGRITYRLLNKIFPAVNAKVVAKNLNTNRTYVTQPNIYGYYDLRVIQAAPAVPYQLKAQDNLGTNWQPAEVTLIISSDKDHLNFVGTPATASAQISF